MDADMITPIPRSCPIPRNVISLIGGNLGPHLGYLLWLNGQEIMIEAPAITYSEPSDPSDPYYVWDLINKAQRNFGHYLEVVQSLLATVEFGGTNWAYLLKDRRGTYYLKQKQRDLAAVSCPLWAQSIYEEEIEFTVWGQANDRRGIWEGEEVDIFYAWSNDDIRRLNRMMYAYRFLEGMDLTYEVYGHLIRKDGTIIGLVSQAAKGRVANVSDRTLIYDAISRIQSRNALYKGCGTNRFMISPEGKVRLLEMYSLCPYQPTELDDMEGEAEIWHWGELDRLFWEFETYGPQAYDYRPLPDRFTASHTTLRFIAPPPTIERPVGGIYLPSNFFSACNIRPWDGYKELLGLQRVATEIRTSRQPRRESPNIDDSEELISESTLDRPLSRRVIATISHRAYNRNRLGLPFHPYRPGRTNGRIVTITRSDDTESTKSCDGEL